MSIKKTVITKAWLIAVLNADMKPPKDNPFTVDQVRKLEEDDASLFGRNWTIDQHADQLSPEDGTKMGDWYKVYGAMWDVE